MLDSVTKKRIDDLRNILVGKIPSPQSQVEQITTGLIYKFMDDMDVEAVEMGGVPSFFVDDYEKYSWKHLFDPKLGGADRVQLYSDAIENMYTNPSAPQLFREIFKNSFLPFKDPSTLNMFLKEINEFHYSHSEKLGDAFEYLLSFMGSQGDAGQFRTPRHIIDFIVEIVNPQKNETILDPACGTAGFLISSYKHILSQNTDKKLGDKLNASDRKQVGDNLVGYDISPDMTRISLVNMYLHQFASPQIHEYDTLSSEDRWNEYYDVILANPPFFSPTGGIQPHTRFGVQSTRAEVLFVDYIMEHLKPTGRAGIVVPEGIIFQTGNAYKTLRKKLVEDCLVGVISLPAGVFQPYSGVKTSILILDKELNQKSDNIFFAKVENDGFSLGTQRTATGVSDLPEIISAVASQGNSEKLTYVSKNDISDKDFQLSVARYASVNEFSSVYEMLCIGEVCEISPKKSSIKHLDGNLEVSFVPMEDLQEGDPNFTAPKIKRLDEVYSGYTYFEDNDVLIAKVTPCFENKKSGVARNLVNGIGFGSSEFIPLRCGEKILPDFLYRFVSEDKFIEKGIENFRGTSGLRRVPKEFVSDYKIPLPPIEVQQQIVDELESYQKIIDGCRQVIENYKPTIDIDPSWEMVELGNIGEIKTGKLNANAAEEDGEFPFFTCSKDTYRINTYAFDGEYILLSGNNASGDFDVKYYNGKFNAYQRTYVIRIVSEEYDYQFVRYVMNQQLNILKEASIGSQTKYLTLPIVKSISVPNIPLDEQKNIIERLNVELNGVDGNLKLMEGFNKKIKDKVSKVWGE